MSKQEKWCGPFWWLHPICRWVWKATKWLRYLN